VHAVAVRDEDQNRLCALPLGSWRTYHFPTIDSAIRFAINSAIRGWECNYKDAVIRRAIGEYELVKHLRAPVQTPKSLRPKKSLHPEPQRPALYRVPENTEWVGKALRTTMADGLVLTWDVCGTCSQFALKCTCPNGISAPRHVDYIAIKTVGYVAGKKWEDIDTTTKTVDTGPQTFVQPWREGRATITPGTTPAPRGKSLRPATQAPSVPVRKSLRDFVPTDTPKPNGKRLRPAQPVSEEPTIEVTEDFELSSLDGAAQAHADSLTKRLTSMTRPLPRKLPGKKFPRKA